MANWTKLGLISSAVFASLTAYCADSQRVTSLNQAEVKALISAQSTLSSNNTYFAPINNHGVKQLKATHQRMQQFVLNTPIWGQQLSVQTASQHVSGFYAANLDVNKLKQLQTQTVNDNDFAQAILKKAKLDANTDYELHETKRYVYLENGDAVFAQLVQLEIKLPNEVLKPTALITEHNNKVVKYWNDIHHAEATGPGGNEKMGRVEFGDDLPAMQVTQDGDTCYLENEKVKTVSLESNDNNTEAFSFPCSRNTHKEINGAYSPLNEAHAYGTAVFDMYNDWYGTAPLTFQLLMRVHYGNSYENAFWNGSAMTFGDGASRFHPLTSLDIVSHEVSHGFTDQNSDLIYREQSGGINEAFSDIAGEAAEFFLRGENDWLIGADIMKTATAIRYFETPSLDGASIDHADDYYGGIDVHYSSGVFNRAFFLLANTEGWGVRKAFDVMVRANQQYWVASTDFVDGACGVINSAIDLGYEIPDVVSAFEQVGVECDNIQFIDADQDGMDDNWELLYGLNPADANDAELDLDLDTLSNLQEYQLGSFPNNTDSDNDGLQDGDEVNQYNTSPANADSDSDRMPDGWEVQYQLDPTSSADANLDNDEDGFSNVIEYFNDTDPTDAASFPEGTLELFYNFEDGLVPESFVHSNQSSPWFVTEIEGQKVLTNNDIGDSQRTSTKFEFVAQQGAISFDYKTDTEQGYDYLEVYLNGEQVLRTSGQQEWSSFNYSVLPGANEIEFVFDKDASVSTQADAVYIDNIYIGDNSLDTDQDGMPDFWEVQYGLDINDASDAAGDLDNDGLSNLAEYQNQTAPNNSDSDSDGMPDGWEVQYGLAPNDPEDATLDADNDGFSNLEEFTLGTEPNNADSFPVALDITTSFEENTLPEWLTTPNDSNAAWVLDTDMATDGQQSIRSGEITSGQTSSFAITGYFDEGLLLFQSYLNMGQGGDFFAVIVNGEYFYSDFIVPEWKTEIVNIPSGLNTIEFLYYEDTDSNSTERFILLDNFIWLPNGSDRDSDSDGMPDHWEVQYGLDINDASDATGDLDNDGLSNLAEYQNQTAPNNSDSDSDGMPDGWEVQYGLAPTDPEDAALDADNDGFSNLEEFTLGTEPNNAESYPTSLDITTSFEGNTLPEWLTTPDSSNAEWVIDRDMTSDGQQSIRSGDISDDEISSFVVSGIFSEGKLLFDLYQDTQQWCCDYLQIFINDEEVYKSYGLPQRTWLYQHISIPEGLNTIEFRYRKDGSYSTEEDLVRLDNFVFLTNNSTRDSDNDGLPDLWELEYGLNWNDSADAQTDSDIDGLTALQEFQAQTSPINSDTDSDQLPDGFEVDNTLNPLNAADAALDNDVDSYTNLQEFYANSDVNSSASLPRQISQLSEDFESDLLPEWFVQTADSTAGWELSTEWHQSGSQSLKVNTDDYNDIAGFAIAGEFEAGLIVFESNGRNIQVYLNDQLVKDVNSYQETMSAISLSNGFNVVRFIGRRSSHIDDISLGIEIPADRDSDSDGIPDVWELEYGLNPRDSYDATHDVDYDGLTNIQEYNLNSNPATNDTDNDGVQDSEDSHPNDASQGENQAPVFVDLSEQKIEARSDRTRLRDIYIPEVTDNGHLEPNVYLVSSNYLELGPHQVTWRARDNVGNETEDHVQTINIVDTTAPEYRRGLSDAVVRTHEQLAALLTERNVFYDRVDQYDVTVSIDPSVSLHSGNRRIPVSVTDKSGNSETHIVDVGILPELIIPEAIVSAQEGELSLPLILDGESPFSSMSLDLEVDGNHVLGLYIDNGDLKLSPQIKVESSLFIEGANIKVKNVSGAYVAEHDTSVLSVKPAQYTPNLTASLMVDQLPTSVLESTQTYAELRFFVEDLNVGNEHEVEVSPALSSGYLDYSTWYRDGTYGFNPSELEVGTHNFTIKVTETNTESPLSSEIVLPITIVAPLELTDADTDNDGISDAEEGVTDRDRDGIVDYLDAISSPSIATLGDNQSLNVLDMSARVTLGQVKSGLTDGFATDMSITAEMVEQYSETAFGSTEQLFDPHYRDISKTASVTAVLLAGNTSATLTLPSQVTTLLNTTPKVRALTSNGWITLEEVQTDESCTHCVAFNVTDGGDMDLDGSVNGQVEVVAKLAIADANRLPELVLEAPESINENTSFELDASQSFDLDKDEISYTWSISNAAIELEPKDDGKVTLTVGELAESIDTVLTLVLNDGYGIVEREFNITFNHVNALPVITLTDFIQVNEQTAVAVSASATDKESTSLSYEWTQKMGLAVEIQDATSQILAFTAPSVTVDKDLEFELAVNDGSDIAKSLIKVKVLNNQTDGSGSGSTDGGSTDGGSTDGGSTDSGS
ncbi:hypothetical protein CWB72_20265, partial [Pseudoalteromonas phenolica]|uniref:M4 family metallopeptidase n=1 Tax=Pseudoalteromonas phenolica TaxID=161398 RepID=UPI00110B6B39